MLRCEASTFIFVLLSGYLDEDVRVTAAHDQQRDDVESDKVEHVVDSFLPSLMETAMGHALSEVHMVRFDGSEDK